MPIPKKTCSKCHAVCYGEFAKYCVCGYKFGEPNCDSFMDMLKKIVEETNNEERK